MVNYPVLVLNQSYEPLAVCRARRALVLIFEGKAEMLENGAGFIHSATEIFPLPSVIRLDYMVKRPYRARKLTRYEILIGTTTPASIAAEKRDNSPWTTLFPAIGVARIRGKM